MTVEKLKTLLPVTDPLSSGSFVMTFHHRGHDVR